MAVEMVSSDYEANMASTGPIARAVQIRSDDRVEEAIVSGEDSIGDCHSQSDIGTAPSQIERSAVPHLESCRSRQSSAFFGRSREAAALLEAFESGDRVSCCEESLDKTSFVLIRGAEGVGKTWLLEKTLKERVASSRSGADHAYYVTYRFDQYQRSHLTRIFDEAFENFVRQCVARGPEEMALVRRLVRDSCELHMESILQIVPAMERILLSEREQPMDEESDSSSCLGHSARRCGLLRGLLRAISKERRIIFVFENLHWAHQPTLDAMSGIVPPVKDSRILFVATYRPECEPFFELSGRGENEVSAVVEKWAKNGVGVRRIELYPLLDKDISNLVSHLLYPIGVSDDVASFVCDTVKGNPSHVLEVLRCLCEWDLLTATLGFSKVTLAKREPELLDALSTCSLHELLRKRILRLPHDTQNMLKVAAVLGWEVNEMLLSHALRITPSDTKLSLASYLEQAVASEVLERYVDYGDYHYRFSSNLAQQASYSFISATARQGFHVAIGRQLWKSMTMDEVNNNLAKVLFQINLGTHLITNQLERYALASLMYSLGSQAAKDSSFVGSSFLFEKALKLLGDDRWRVEHDLCLAIYNALAETKYAIGDFDRVSSIVKEILANARSFDEQLQARCTFVYMLVADNKMTAALDEGLALLRELGEPLPKKHLTRRQIYRSYRSTNRKLRGKSLEFILRLPPMTDSRKLAAMTLMNILFSSAYMTEPLLAASIGERMMKLTLKHGTSTITSSVLGLRGMLLCGEHFSRFEEGYEYGQLALRMLEKYKAQEFIPRVYAGVYGEINSFTRPVRHSLKPLWRSVVTAMETGDIEMGVLNSNIYCTLAFYIGHPLAELKERLDQVRQDMALLNQKSFQALNIPILMTVNALLGHSVELSEDMTVPLDQSKKMGWLCGVKCLRAYVLGDYGAAAGFGKEFLRTRDQTFRSVDCLALSAYASLALITEYREHRKMRRRDVLSETRSSLKLLEKMAKHNPDFCLSKLHLLKAELLAMEKKPDEAYGHFTIAIAMGIKTGYLMDEAVANERAGRYMLNGEGKQKWAAFEFLEGALDAYKRWGAAAKVQHLETELEQLKQEQTVHSSSLTMS